jgi:hypothetical protein
MSGGSHELNMINSIPQDENKSCLCSFCLLYTFFTFLTSQFESLSLKFCILAEYIRRKPDKDTSKNAKKYVSLQWKINILQWKYGKWKYVFSFINISQYFIYKYIIKEFITCN